MKNLRLLPLAVLPLLWACSTNGVLQTASSGSHNADIPVGPIFSGHLYISGAVNIRSGIGQYEIPLTNASVPSGTLGTSDVYRGLCADKAGQIAATGFDGLSTDRLDVFNPPITSGEKRSFSLSSTFPASGCTFDAESNLYVVSRESFVGSALDLFLAPVGPNSRIARTIARPSSDEAYDVASDSQGDIFTINLHDITEYAPAQGSNELVTTFGVGYDNGAAAFAPDGRLFTTGGSSTVNIYSPPFYNGETPRAFLHVPNCGIAVGIAFDAASDLFVSCLIGAFSGNLVELPPPYATPTATIVNAPYVGSLLVAP